MSDLQASAAAPRLSRRTRVAGRPAGRSALPFWLVTGVIAVNALLIIWLWVHGGNVTRLHSTGDVLTSIARLTGLLGAYAALIGVVLLARIPWIERAAGFDRLTVWHRWVGHACLYLVLAHVVFSIWGYSELDRLPLTKEISTMIAGGIYPGMITATIGTALFVATVLTSIVIVRRRLRYEAWYAVHLTAYLAIALAWFHQIPTGNELVLDKVAADYWRGLYVATIALLVGFRVLVPVVNAFRFRLRVTGVVHEALGVTSLTIEGRRLERLHAQAGQFFLWRFLTRDRWWASHPFSLSAAPDGHSLRVTVKALGDFSSRLGSVAPGTRVIAEGPFGVFTEAKRRTAKALLIAGGIGITPVRALLEEMEGDLVVIYRVVDETDVLFDGELRKLAETRGAILHLVVGDHRAPRGQDLLSPAHLEALVPDICERDVYICGPPAMADAVRARVRAAAVPTRRIHTERFAL